MMVNGSVLVVDENNDDNLGKYVVETIETTKSFDVNDSEGGAGGFLLGFMR